MARTPLERCPGSLGLLPARDRYDVGVQGAVGLGLAADLDVLAELDRVTARIDDRALVQVNIAVDVAPGSNLHLKVLEIGHFPDRLVGQALLLRANDSDAEIDRGLRQRIER